MSLEIDKKIGLFICLWDKVNLVCNNWTHSAYKFPLERRHLWKPLFSLGSETHCDDARAFTINEGRLILS